MLNGVVTDKGFKDQAEKLQAESAIPLGKKLQMKTKLQERDINSQVTAANVAQVTTKTTQTQAVRHADKLVDGKGDIFCFKCDLYFVIYPLSRFKHGDK